MEAPEYASVDTGEAPWTPSDEVQKEGRMIELLDECRHWWEARQDYRDRRGRARDYYRGKQWDELIVDPDDPDTTAQEKTIIERQGRIAWVMNHVGATVRNLKGQYRQNRSERAVYAVSRQDTEATEMMNVALRGVRRYNKMKTVEADQFEEHILSGACAWRVGIQYDSNLNRNEVRVFPVDQTRLFFNLDIRDRRMEDIRIIGELHDLTMPQILMAFAHGEDGQFQSERAQQLRSFYTESDEYHYDQISDYGREYTDSAEFWDTHDQNLYRVFEVWKQQFKLVQFAHDLMTGDYGDFTGDNLFVAAVNAEREMAGQPGIEIVSRYEPVWHCYFLGPRGEILYESDTPYWHESHPYIVGLSVLIDGDTWGLVEQIIDPQRWLNRLVASMDHSLMSAAKGVLLVPEDAIPGDMDISDFAETWSRANGVLKIKLKPGASPPIQIANASIPNDMWMMMDNLKTWIQEVSGVTGPMQGYDPKSGTPASLYQQQVVQASTTNLDYFESYLEAIYELDRKMLKVIMQAFDEERYLNEPSLRGFIQYDPQAVREVDFDVAAGNVTDTATYRQLWEQDLQTFLTSGYIDFFTYLEMSSHPKADALMKLLQQGMPELGGMPIQAVQAGLQQGASAGMLPPARA